MCKECVRLERISNSHAGPSNRQWAGCGEISGIFWSRILKEARRRDIPVKITIEYIWYLFIKQRRKCALSGEDIEVAGVGVSAQDRRNRRTASLDRIDSSKGYFEDNVQWVHKDVNIMKMAFSQERYIEVCKKVAMVYS